MLGPIGRGAYAEVKLGEQRTTKEKVAIKGYDRVRLLDIKRKKSVQREIGILKLMKHPNCLNLVDVVDTSKNLFLITEYIDGCSLFQFLRKKHGRKLEEPIACRIFQQIVQGVAYCHQKNVAHRDIKLENILLDRSQKVKIIDFGFSTCMAPDKKIKMFCGTPSYMAPEIVGKREYVGIKADIWALGVVLYALLTGSFPFKGLTTIDLYGKIGKGVFHIPPTVSKQAKTLLEKLMTVSPNKRPTALEILTDPWFEQIKEKRPPLLPRNM